MPLTDLNPNPFTLVYDALWQLVEQFPNIDDLISPRNRVNFGSADDRGANLKQNIQAADLPELILIGSTASGNLFADSCNASVTRQYTFLISTGDLRQNQFLMPVEWLLFCALANYSPTLKALEWPVGSGRKFVTDLKLLSEAQGQSDPERNRGIKGWSATWACEVRMHINRADVLAVAQLAGSASSSIGSI
jgi:hypothetical protein